MDIQCSLERLRKVTSSKNDKIQLILMQELGFSLEDNQFLIPKICYQILKNFESRSINKVFKTHILLHSLSQDLKSKVFNEIIADKHRYITAKNLKDFKLNKSSKNTITFTITSYSDYLQFRFYLFSKFQYDIIKTNMIQCSQIFKKDPKDLIDLFEENLNLIKRLIMRKPNIYDNVSEIEKSVFLMMYKEFVQFYPSLCNIANYFTKCFSVLSDIQLKKLLRIYKTFYKMHDEFIQLMELSKYVGLSSTNLNFQLPTKKFLERIENLIMSNIKDNTIIKNYKKKVENPFVSIYPLFYTKNLPNIPEISASNSDLLNIEIDTYDFIDNNNAIITSFDFDQDSIKTDQHNETRYDEMSLDIFSNLITESNNLEEQNETDLSEFEDNEDEKTKISSSYFLDFFSSEPIGDVNNFIESKLAQNFDTKETSIINGKFEWKENNHTEKNIKIKVNDIKIQPNFDSENILNSNSNISKVTNESKIMDFDDFFN